jgi:predicted PurR-regulated permease PerM
MVTSNSILKKLLLILLTILLLYVGKDFLMPIAIGGVLATLFLPLCKWLEKNIFNKALAALICLFILLILITSAIALIGWKISALTYDFVQIKQKAMEAFSNAQEYIFYHLGISVEKQSQILNDEQPSISLIMQKVGGSISSIFTSFILVLAYLFLLLYYRIHIQNFLLKLTNLSNQEQTKKLIYSLTNVSRQYLIGLSKMIVCLWIMYSIGFGLLGVKNAIFFAVLCGLLEIVPFIGNITGTTLTVLVSALQGSSLPVLLGIIATYAIVQFIQGWVLEPLIVGRQVKINPLFTIIALVLGELIWGIPGIFLAIPLLAMFKALCDHVKSLQPLGFLIGEIESKKNELTIIKKVKSLYDKRPKTKA